MVRKPPEWLAELKLDTPPRPRESSIDGPRAMLTYSRLPLFDRMASAILIFTAAIAISPRARAQPEPRGPSGPPPESTPAPRPDVFLGFESDPFSPEFNRDRGQPVSPPPATQDDLTLDILQEPDGPYVNFGDFVRVVRSVDPRAQGEWDGLMGVFRISAAGRNLQALAHQPVLVIDGRYRPVTRPIKVRSGSVLLPLESVKVLLEALKFDFEIEGETAAVAEPAARERPRDGAVGPRPAGAASPAIPIALIPAPAGASAPDETETFLTHQGSLLSTIGERGALPPVEAPEGPIGLTWGQLADAAHRAAPRRLTLIHDAELADLARRTANFVTGGVGLEVRLIPVDRKRADPALLSEVARAGGDLALDLMLAGEPGADAPDPAGAFEIWAVHEALWPGETGERPEPRRTEDPYRPHQFHNLALASLLRVELSRSFAEWTVRQTLAPAYLLRRIEAPAAAAVIPRGILDGGGPELDRVATALAGGLIAYCRGIESAL